MKNVWAALMLVMIEGCVIEEGPKVDVPVNSPHPSPYSSPSASSSK